MSRFLIALAAVTVLLAPANVDAGACARQGLDAAVLTHPDDAIPVGGGVLVGYARLGGLGLGDDYGTDPTKHADWRFVVKKKKLRPTLTQLAPGLAVYTSKKLTSGAKLTLADGHGQKLGAFKMARKTKKKAGFTAAAPSGKIELSSYSSPRSGTSWSAMVTFDAAIPADAVAVVVYDTAGNALTWGNVKNATGRSVNVFSSPGRCAVNPPDMQAPSAQQHVQLAWVDEFGRLSPRSAELVVIDQGTTP